jgi:hypothetical protein
MNPIDNPPDDILAELHATRRQLLQQHGGVAGLAAFLRQQEAAGGEQIAKPNGESASENGPRPAKKRPIRLKRPE